MLCLTRFFPVFTALMLSHKRGTVLIWTPKSSSWFLIQRIWAGQEESTTYSASVVERATEFYFLVPQEISKDQRKWVFLEVLFIHQITIRKITFDIHLIEFKTHKFYKGYEDCDRLYLSNMGQCLIIVDAFLLIITLANQYGLVSSYNPTFISLFLNIHLVPLMVLSSCIWTRYHTLICSNGCSSSCLEVT